MVSIGRVREWSEADGWGIVDSAETPGGCWTHFSRIAMSGYRSLRPGQSVRLEWETPGQDGFAYRAVRVWPEDADPITPVHGDTTGAYRSILRLE